MNKRWSFIKRFGRVTREEFILMADTFIKAANEAVGQLLMVNIVLYKDAPSYPISSAEDGVGEWVKTENKEKEFKSSMFPAELSSPVILAALVSDKEFIIAANIQLKIRLAKDNQSDRTFGVMECKLLSDRILFYFQSNEERVCQSLVEACIEAGRASKIL